MTQKFSSKNTSRPQIAATFKAVTFKKTDKVLDYGGGRYDIAAEFMAEKVSKFSIFDPYWRTEEHNAEVMSGEYNIITCNNVLNVIAEDEILLNIVETIFNKLPEGGTAYFLIKAVEKKFEGAYISPSGYQRNTPPAEYTDFITSQPWTTVRRKGNLFTCEK